MRAADGIFTIITFPKASDTEITDINTKGAIIGDFLDKHGVPGAFFARCQWQVHLDRCSGIERNRSQCHQRQGRDCGDFHGRRVHFHSFVQTTDGTIAPFDAPGADGRGTFAESINASGTIAGRWEDSFEENHAFLRTPDGTIVSFDPDGTVFGDQARGINKKGAITGPYTDGGNITHGYLRHPDGTFTTFDPPGSISTSPARVNDKGAITGLHGDGTTTHGFLLSK